MTTLMQYMQQSMHMSDEVYQQVSEMCNAFTFTQSSFSNISLFLPLSILALSSLCSLAALLPLL